MAGSIPEEPSVYSPVLVMLQKRLEERGFEAEKSFEAGDRKKGMRPIYTALREMDRIEVRLAKGKDGSVVTKLNVANMNQKRPFRIRLWNLEMGQAQVVSLQVDKVSSGEYWGEWVSLRDEGWWRWKHEVGTKMESQHLNDMNEAIAWLVEKLAPCVVDAGGLSLRSIR